MTAELMMAKDRLTSVGLQVKPSGDHALWIAATTRSLNGSDRRNILLSHNACVLLYDGKWTAIFPGPGATYNETHGGLEELLELIQGVYGELQVEEPDGLVYAFNRYMINQRG